MFSRISKLGKNISDEFESVVTKTPSSSRSSSYNRLSINGASMAAAFEALKSSSPEPTVLDASLPADHNESDHFLEPIEDDKLHDTEHDESIVLSRDISSKLRKFKKYEEKYPGMFKGFASLYKY